MLGKFTDVRNVVALIVSLGIAQLTGIIGSIFTLSAIPTWYAGIVKPEFAPPNWVFGPVWTILFLFMGVASFLVWRNGSERRDVKLALGVYGFQLVLNVLWSILFFGLESPFSAFVEIIFLWLGILATIILFSKISKAAPWLLAPYILWVTFASCLNFSIWNLN